MTRPAGWPAGVYDGTFGEDGLRLFRDGSEVLHLAVGTAVQVSGAELTFAVPGGELAVEVRLPAPADPKATALAFALHLAGGRERRERILNRTYGVPGWLVLVALLPLTASVVGAFLGGYWVPGVGILTTVLSLVVFRSNWDVAKRTHTVVGLSVFGVFVVAVATAVGMTFRGVRATPPVYR